MKMIHIEDKDWDDNMEKMCVCGHKLYQHGFTIASGEYLGIPAHKLQLNVSQCVLCPYDNSVCEEYEPVK